ncbi:MAG: hypothetical protein C5B50_17275 [Verrucomicrobia bacterium]|nr:MAG: hypothetical protein C5B50_17275 [Verrucomicrobiota bacterium]
MKFRTLPLVVSVSTALSASAGTFTNSFDSGLPAGTTAYGTAAIKPNFATGSGSFLLMTSNLNNQTSGFVISDLDAGAQIGGFAAYFNLLLGGGSTASPADGFSLNFATNLPNGTVNEEGAGNGLTVEFDTFSNGGADNIGIDLKWNGAEVATTTVQAALWPQNTAVSPSYVASVAILLHAGGTLDLNYNGTQVYSGQPTGFLPTTGRFGLGSRTGGANEYCIVDNLGLTTTPVANPQFRPASFSPTNTNIRPDPLLIAQMWNGYSTQVNTNTIQMRLNGTLVTPRITQTNNAADVYAVTTVQYQVPPSLAPGSSNTVVITFSDNNTPTPNSFTTNFSFVVANYLTIPGTYAATADTSKPGFTQRVFQGGTATVNSIANAENLLGGFLINPANGLPFPNTATTNTDGTWTFIQTNVLNYNISAPTCAGDFCGDVLFPAIPGTNASTINFAVEAITWLYLTNGAYTFGVNSDDGFKLSCLDKTLGLFDAGRGAADTTFSFVVAQTGYYPFRLVYFQGTSAASLEWFSVTPAGQKILINDTATPGYIQAYSSATRTLPYFLGFWPGGAGNRPDQPVRVQMQDGIGVNVNTNTIRLTINGATVTPAVTQAGGLTTILYSSIWASGSANTGTVWFADNEVSPVSQTNQFTFSVVTYPTIPTSYAVSAGAVNLTKPGFAQKVFQTDQPIPFNIANAETMLAGRLTDAAGNLLPNKAATNTDGTFNFPQANVINYNIAAPATAGDFSGDSAFPGIPGPSSSTIAFAQQAITYLYLPAGYYVLGVNSDDGFRLGSAPNPLDQFPFVVAYFDGTRTAADTTGGFVITQTGYYPFRLVYYQGFATASLELFSVALSGQKILVNDTNTTASLRGYSTATDTQPYVQWAFPESSPGFTAGYSLSATNPIAFTLVNGTPAIQLGSIQMIINGTNIVSPTVTQPNGTNIVVSYVPYPFQQSTDTVNNVQLTWADTSGNYHTNSFQFIIYGTQSLLPVWNIPPGFRAYLTTDVSASNPTNMEAGMAYIPQTGHLVVGSITNITGLRGFFILDALTAADVGQLAQTNSAGVNVFAPASNLANPGYSLGVADDGAIYAADRKLAASGYNYQIYRWASETSPVSVAYSEPTGHFNFALGLDFRVRGAGPNTQIIAGASSGATALAVLFLTSDGINFTDKPMSIIGVNSDLYAGIGFGSNNTFYADGYPGGVLRYVSFNTNASSGSALAAYTWAAPTGSFGPLGVDLLNGHIVGLATSATAGTTHTVNLFNIASLSTSGTNTPLSSRNTTSSNVNPNGSGAVAFTPDGSKVFVLDSQNGLSAYQLTLGTPATPATITHIAYGNPVVVSGVGPASHPFVLISSTNIFTPYPQWTSEQTNTALTGSFSFNVAPGTAKSKFFRIITQ